MQEILLLRKTLPSRSSQNIHQRKYLCEVMHNRVFYTSQKVRIRVVRCPGVSFISTRRGFWFYGSTIGFLYLSKGLEFRLSGDGDYDSSHYKESIPYFAVA